MEHTKKCDMISMNVKKLIIDCEIPSVLGARPCVNSVFLAKRNPNKNKK